MLTADAASRRIPPHPYSQPWVESKQVVHTPRAFDINSHMHLSHHPCHLVSLEIHPVRLCCSPSGDPLGGTSVRRHVRIMIPTPSVKLLTMRARFAWEYLFNVNIVGGMKSWKSQVVEASKGGCGCTRSPLVLDGDGVLLKILV
jgi:hypothetical protein